jgi:hypothetical protein
MKSLWGLLILLCCSAAIGGATASAKFARVGFGGYTFSIAVGSVVGLGCAWTMEKVGKTVATRLQRSEAPVQERYFRALYFGAMLWIAFALFLGIWATQALLRPFKM